MVGLPRLESLTGLRAVAAIVVFLFHFQLTSADAFGRGVFDDGFVGVGFFFMLSGVVLAWTWNPARTLGRFYWLRFARVYPLYVTVVLVAWVANIAQGEGMSFRALVPSVLLVQAWVPSESVYFGVQPVFWSLSVEAFFYLMFPLFFPALVRATYTRRNALVGLAVIGVVLAAVLASSYEGAWVWFVYISPPVRFLEFFIGTWIGLGLRNRIFPAVSLTLASTIVLIAYAGLRFVPASFKPSAAMLVPFSLVLIAAAATDIQASSSIFRSSFLLKLGAWSYGFYLMHTMVIGIGGRLGIQRSLSAALLLMTSAFLLAWIGFVTIEDPARKWLAGHRINSSRSP